MTTEHIHFVTGRLAEASLRSLLAELAPQAGFEYSVDVLGITVAALMTPRWVAPRLSVPPATSRVILPGYCEGELEPVAQAAGVPVERGPKDLRELPEYFGAEKREASDYGRHDIEILAEINLAPRLPLNDIVAAAARLREAGADVIDVGCDPAITWSGVGQTVRALRAEGHRVSIDSTNVEEIAAACKAGAELVLSVDAKNRHAAADWGREVVVVPDVPGTLDGLEATIELLDAANVRWRLDPILEPIGFGLAASLGRYLEARRRWPRAEMMMGIGNLTELTDVDSAGINVLLLGFCQELGIHSVLTTEVINWARTSVRECDLARRLVHHAVTGKVLPKHVEPRLVMLRDPKLLPADEAMLDQLAAAIKDHNYRIFAEDGRLHVLSAGQHLVGDDPFELFDQLAAARHRPLEPSHAFYLGYEMAKALTALTLGKQYRQDEALNWGLLTRAEQSHLARRHAEPTRDAKPSTDAGSEGA